MSTLKTNTLSNVAGTASTAIENAINGSAKAWVNFNGTGTVAIRQSYNVSSITDNGLGIYTINFTNPMPDANYSYVTAEHYYAGGSVTNTGLSAISSSSFQINILTYNFSNWHDSAFVSIAVFR